MPRTTPWAYWMTNLPNSKHQFSGAIFVLGRYFLYCPYLLQVGWNHRPEKNHHLPFALKLSCLGYILVLFWSNYSDLTRPHPKLWLSKGHPLISGKSRLVKYHEQSTGCTNTPEHCCSHIPQNISKHQTTPLKRYGFRGHPAGVPCRARLIHSSEMCHKNFCGCENLKFPLPEV